MQPQSVLVVGAGELGAGELGVSILRGLHSHTGRQSGKITVLLRPASDNSKRTDLLNELKALNVNIVYYDLASPAEDDLIKVFSQYDTVVSATGFANGPGTQTRLTQAVLASRAKWYIPWQFGVDYDQIGKGSSQPLFDEQLQVREMLRGQDRLKWTIISTGIFTSFFLDPAFGVVDLNKGAFRALGGWENRVTVTSAEDIGRITAEVILGQDKPAGVIQVAGDTVNFSQVYALLASAGWQLSEEVLTIAELEKRLQIEPKDIGAQYQLIWARNIGVAWSKEGSWNVKQGMVMETVEDWVSENLSRAS